MKKTYPFMIAFKIFPTTRPSRGDLKSDGLFCLIDKSIFFSVTFSGICVCNSNACNPIYAKADNVNLLLDVPIRNW